MVANSNPPGQHRPARRCATCHLDLETCDHADPTYVLFERSINGDWAPVARGRYKDMKRLAAARWRLALDDQEPSYAQALRHVYAAAPSPGDNGDCYFWEGEGGTA